MNPRIRIKELTPEGIHDERCSKELPELSNSVCCSLDLKSDPDREMDSSDSGDEYQRILGAMKAESEGNEEAHSFLFQLYYSDQMPPD